ncbi:hypothetical protein DFA_08179 [Cavenderia fasciculata]|uniref:Uncharacterized protein n=1 Tax=Cavenderia fasciculata TaxID=261658 RepID=F4Q5D3_CACFS|nr:uncharacterized protein DFA_08179 [Cavenderia fasciculata]EGG17192.1 hypothetical protein DFA_08179 [Cavenderia fasciculata]|eukprot:XP_004355676.1 hypothetical protein DFA_08179 [Cavenderia fasciculata]
MELKDIQSVVVWRLIFQHLFNRSPKSLAHFSSTNKTIREKINATYNWKELALKNVPQSNNIAKILGINVDEEPEHSLKWASMYQYYRFIYDATKFGHIAHMNTQYLESVANEDIAYFLPFPEVIRLNYVWWYDVGELIKDIPVNNYKVYWMLNCNFTDTYQFEVDIQGEESEGPLIVDRKVEPTTVYVREWSYTRGPDARPNPNQHQLGSTFSMFCKMHQRDSSYTKRGLFIAYILLVPDDDLLNMPKRLFVPTQPKPTKRATDEDRYRKLANGEDFDDDDYNSEDNNDDDDDDEDYQDDSEDCEDDSDNYDSWEEDDEEYSD